jgi:hypothetical protein
MAKAPMSALTIRQPYAWLIVNGYKDIENRTWKPAAARIGQRFWVHASQRRLTKADFEEFLADMQHLGIQRYPKSIDAVVCGAIVGSAVIEDVVRGSESFWAVRGNHHWVRAGRSGVRQGSARGSWGSSKCRGARVQP